MATVFLIHGLGGSPTNHWFPWLRSKLEEQGHTVITPSFPSGEDHTLDSWLSVMDSYRDSINDDTVFVAHSMGPLCVLAFLETINSSVKGCFFVAGFTGSLGDRFDSPNATFLAHDMNWDLIKRHCKHFVMINALDDPFVPLERGKNLADALGIDMITMEQGGHFNSASGTTEFPLLLEKLGEIL